MDDQGERQKERLKNTRLGKRGGKAMGYNINAPRMVNKGVVISTWET